MSIWKDSTRKDWRYAFQFKLKRYAGGGFKSRREAISAQAARRKQVKAAYDAADIPIDDIDDKYESLKAKYISKLQRPVYTLPDLIDEMMKDFDLPYGFKNVAEIVKRHSKARASIPAKLRLEVIKRDGGACIICGRKPPEVTLHVDHIIPASKGGLTESRNLQTLCQDCNLGKSNSFVSVAADCRGLQSKEPLQTVQSA